MSEDSVDAGPSRQHLKMLEYHGMSTPQMAELSGVPRPTIAGLMVTGERQWSSIARATAERLCAIPMPDGYLKPNTGGPVHMSEIEESISGDPAEESDIEPHTALAAAKVAACYAANADELRMLMSMLGIGKAVLA
ncbi:hypothetical protein [Nocardia aurea]|uniref:hypothetical protein n=1 Tax=Nocardia aurea TaxID=2144174 RepID=UPI0033AC40DD